MLLSVIVPVYNAEKYLPRCLDSLLDQGLDEAEYEIICVDDGSGDGSKEIIGHYAEQHACVKPVFQQNAGVGCARNKGLELATGDVITFCDADDYLIPNGLSYLLDNFWDEQVEVLCHASITLDAHRLQTWKEDNDASGNVIIKGDGRCVYLRNPKYFVWNALVRRSYLQSLELKFRPMTMAEDACFMLEVMMNAKSVLDVSSNIYRYTVNDSQITRQRDPLMMRKCIEDYLYFFSRLGYYQLDQVYSQQKIPFYSRVLSAHLNKTEYLSLVEKSSNQNLCVVPYCIYSLFSVVHRKLFVPFILPRLSRG